MYLYYEFLDKTIIIWPTVLGHTVVYLYVYGVWHSEESNRPLFHLDMKAVFYTIKKDIFTIVPLKKIE